MLKLPRYIAARQATSRILDPGQTIGPLSRMADMLLMGVILLTVIAITLESIEALRVRYADIFATIELIVVILFTFEYGLRVWSVVDHPDSSGFSNTRARLRYMVSPMALVDLVAVLPFYLVQFGLVDTTASGLILRSIRLLRILKLTRYSSSITVLTSVVKENLRALGAAVFLLMVVMMIAASGIYIFEHEAQPTDFGSIPAAMWWAFATLTTVGYGDVTPITAWGKVFGASITVIGVGMVALPTAILASAFSAQLQERARQFSRRVDEAIEDGDLTPYELKQLEAFREELGLGSELARQILLTERSIASAGEHEHTCPHCHRPFGEGGHDAAES